MSILVDFEGNLAAKIEMMHHKAGKYVLHASHIYVCFIFIIFFTHNYIISSFSRHFHEWRLLVMELPDQFSTQDTQINHIISAHNTVQIRWLVRCKVIPWFISFSNQ